MIQKKAVIIYIEEEARNIGAASPRLCGLGGTVKKPSEAGRGTRDRVGRSRRAQNGRFTAIYYITEG